MSYLAAEALQKAVFSALVADVALHDLVGGHVFDTGPAGAAPALYVQLGPEAVRARSDASGDVARHDVVVSVVSNADAFAGAKAAAARVSEVLYNADLTLERGRLVQIAFRRATAKRVRGAAGRQIELTFRALIDVS